MRYAPFLFFAWLALSLGVVLAVHKQNNPLASPLIGKALPEFSIPALNSKQTALQSMRWKGKPILINIFSSWCVPCQAEHALLKQLQSQSSITMIGIAWRDTAANISAYLQKNGNPYTEVGVDQGTLTTLLGITGVPETYLINADGVVVYKYPGPLTPQEIQNVLLPLIKQITPHG